MTLLETVPRPVAHSGREKVAQIKREFTPWGNEPEKRQSHARSGIRLPTTRVGAIASDYRGAALAGLGSRVS
jgi:hypothetical protein